MIVDMIGALTITKVPILWGHAPLYPKEVGFWETKSRVLNIPNE